MLYFEGNNFYKLNFYSIHVHNRPMESVPFLEIAQSERDLQHIIQNSTHTLRIEMDRLYNDSSEIQMNTLATTCMMAYGVSIIVFTLTLE